MINRVFASFLVAAIAIGTFQPTSASAADTDARFFQKLNGKWKGPGEIVAGKYKGTKFTCDFDGITPNDNLGMTLDGACRVGMFSQKMKATVARAGGNYKGAFLDGAQGEGLDVVAGSVAKDRVVLTLKRKQLDGAMLARLASDDQMNVTVSVNVNDELVPVIGMKLKRVDGVAVGSVR